MDVIGRMQMKRRYRYTIIVASIVLLLVALRIALPAIVRDQINSHLDALEGYDGHVDDVDIGLVRGAYSLSNIRIVKTGADQPTPFFSAERIDFAMEWRSLMHGKLVAAAAFYRPHLNLVQAQTDKESQLGKEVNWAQRLQQMFPFQFNTVRIYDGVITFRAPGIRTQDALVVDHIDAQLTNLTNVVETGKDAFAHFEARARTLGSGISMLSGSVDPLAPQPTFDLNLTLRNIQLPKLNPWLRRFIKADAESGTFELYMELAAADGKFKGYAKPVMQNVKIYTPGEDERSALQRLWEGVIETATKLLENKEKEQVAARIPISGTIENPHAGVFATIVSVLRNAFIGAFAHALEGSISVRDVQKSLRDIEKQSQVSEQKTDRSEKKNQKEKSPRSDKAREHER